jgi:hypothetical protein
MSLVSLLNESGIARVDDVYSGEELRALDSSLDPLLHGRADQRRSYVHIDELHALGVLDVVLNQKMRDALFAIMPDPVLYHCFVIETAGNDPEANLFADHLAGWHRDPDCSYSRREPTHVSVFAYLSDVGDDDGGFAFVPQSPEKLLRSSTRNILVTGNAGYTFAWQRSFYHRASPNRGPRRRRIVKISVQRNAFPSVHLASPHYRAAIDAIPSGDPATDVLLGRYQGRTAPRIVPRPAVAAAAIAPTGRLGIDDGALLRAQLRKEAADIKGRLKRLLGERSRSVAAYDS